MQTVSARFLSGLGLARWAVKVEWSPDAGVTWLPCTFAGGSITTDASSQTRWSASLTLRDIDVSRTGFAMFATRVRVFSGMVFGPDDVEWCALGVYLAQTLERSTTDPDSFTFSGKSLEQQVVEDRFPAPRSWPAGQSARYLTSVLIGESVQGASVQWRVDNDITLPAIVEERDRWGVIDGRPDATSIAKALGAAVFCDARGTFVMAPVGSLADEPVFTLDTGDGGVLVEAAESLSSENVYNAISVRGVADDGQPAVGPVFFADTEPSSPTWIGLRRKTMFYASPKLKTIGQCNKVAQAQLAPNLGLAQQVDVTSVYNPALEADDVVMVRMPDGSLQRHVIDSINFNPGGGTMTLQTRSASTSLAGQPVDAATLTGDQEDSSAA